MKPAYGNRRVVLNEPGLGGCVWRLFKAFPLKELTVETPCEVSAAQNACIFQGQNNFLECNCCYEDKKKELCILKGDTVGSGTGGVSMQAHVICKYPTYWSIFFIYNPDSPASEDVFC